MLQLELNHRINVIIMNLKILYDNNAKTPFKAGWGFSCLIESNENKILFDTGWNGNILLHNMKKADINPEEIDKIIISHSHWDHIGGLNHLLNYGKKFDVYVPKSASINFKNEIKRYANLVEISKPVKIHGNIWTTGELGEKIKEQSLLITIEKGNLILTGCAHPGLDNIIEKSREFGEINTVIGGFHNSNIDVLKGIPTIIPCHCTQEIEKIKKKMPESYRYCEVGFNLLI